MTLNVRRVTPSESNVMLCPSDKAWPPSRRVFVRVSFGAGCGSATLKPLTGLSILTLPPRLCADACGRMPMPNVSSSIQPQVPRRRDILTHRRIHPQETGKDFGHFRQGDHIRSVALRAVRLRVRFDKDPVRPAVIAERASTGANSRWPLELSPPLQATGPNALRQK